MESSLFDTILEISDRSNGPRIVSEVHDTNQINVDEAAIEAAMRGLGGARSWDAREYGITAEQAAAELRAAQTPEARERVIADLKQRALQRFGITSRNGKLSVFVAGDDGPAWHRLGVQFDGYVDKKTGIKASGQDYNVILEPVRRTNKDGSVTEYTGARLVIRSDNDSILGHVGSIYTVFPNDELWEFADVALGKGGFQYASGGVYDDGRAVFIAAKANKCLEVVPGDFLDQYVVFLNRHDGNGLVRVLPSTFRPECKNTATAVLRNGHRKGFGVRHTTNVKERIAEAARAHGFAAKALEKFGQAAETLVRTPLPKPEAYFNDVLDCCLEITAANANKGAGALAAALQVTEAERELAAKRFAKQIERRKNVLDDMLDRYESERCQPKGTGWAAWNAVTESVNYGEVIRHRGTSREKSEKRFESIVAGSGQGSRNGMELTQVALEKALAQ